MTTPEDERTAVYRLYDAENQLLYIGISNDPERRWKQHATDKLWWPLVAQRNVDWHPSREVAEAAELVAVRAETPLYNTAGSTVSMLAAHFPVPDVITQSQALARLTDILDGTQHHSQHVEITRRGKRAGVVVPPEWYDSAVDALNPAPPRPPKRSIEP